jgi:hypothetical protein
MDKLHFDRTDYSVVVKNRAPPPNSWRWEIYRAGRSSPIRQSTTYFHTMAAASKEGKEALKQLLAGFRPETQPSSAGDGQVRNGPQLPDREARGLQIPPTLLVCGDGL